jgi:hypothetical protein
MLFILNALLILANDNPDRPRLAPIPRQNSGRVLSFTPLTMLQTSAQAADFKVGRHFGEGQVTPPADWKTFRSRWDLLHRWRVVLLTIAFAFLIVGVGSK